MECGGLLRRLRTGGQQSWQGAKGVSKSAEKNMSDMEIEHTAVC